MRKKSILMATLMMVALVWAMPAVAQERAENTVIENPQFGASNINTLTIDRVELTPDSTRLHMTAHHSPRSWVRIARETYIRVKGEKLTMTSAEGITPDKEFYSDETNRTHFVLNFPAVAADAQTLDFIEGDVEDYFKIWDVALTPEALQMEAATPADVQAWANVLADGQPLATPVWKSGKATLKGSIRGYRPEMAKGVELYYDDPVTGSREHPTADIRPDGSFQMTVPVATDIAGVAFCCRSIGLWWVEVFVTPGEETEMYIDLVAKSHQQTKNKALRSKSAPYIFFRGANASINNGLQLPEAQKLDDASIPTQKWMKDIVNMSLDEYKAYYMDFYGQQMKKLAESHLPTDVKEYVELKLKRDICYNLFFGDYHLENAFRKAHNLGRKDSLVGYNTPVYTEEYYSFLRELDMNNPKNLLIDEYPNNVNSSKYIGYNLYDINALLNATTAKQLLESKKLNRKERKLLKKISRVETMQEFRKLIETDNGAPWKALQEEHKFYELWEEQTIPVRKLAAARIMGTDEGLLFDLIATQTLCAPLDERMLIPEKNLRKAEQLADPFFARHMREKNTELAAVLEAQKNRGGYTVHQATDSKGEALLVDIVQQFKGKVIFIDLWATWCGPCRSAMTMFKPAKQKLKDKDIAFVYLTDHTSPESAWKNMIPTIEGEHYRLKNEQLNSLRQTFGFTGVPSYLIINKKGEVVYSHTGFEGNEKITKLLIEELKK